MFENVNRMPCGCTFSTADELLSIVERILIGIEESSLAAVCHDGIRRLQLHIEIEAKSTK